MNEHVASLDAAGCRRLLIELAATQTAVAARLSELEQSSVRRSQKEPPVDVEAEAGYISVRELAQRIPYSEGTIRNLMSQGCLKLGTHYVKPNGRVMFRWDAMQTWLTDQKPKR